MAKIVFLGTSASVASYYRDNTCLYFYDNKNHLLIDCAGSIVQKLYRIRVDFRRVYQVIITHQHIDHYYGLFHLIHAQAYLNKKLTIYSNPSTISLCRSLLKQMKLTRKQHPKITFKNVFQKKYFYYCNGFKIKTVKNCHVDGSFGIIISSANKKVLYSSDTAMCDSIIDAAYDCDYIIHDCSASSSYFCKHPQLFRLHTNSRDLTRAVKDSKAKKVIPIHFLLLREGEEKRIRKELEPLGKKLFFASDFDVIRL